MATSALLLLIMALGHASFVVLAVNVSHGLGFRSRFAELATLLALGAVALATLAVGHWLIRHDWAIWPWPLKLYGVVCLGLGAIGLPVTTVVRWLRKSPSGISARSEERDVPSLAGVLAREDLIGSGRHAGFLRWPGNDALRLQVNDCQVRWAGLPRELEGLSLVQLTDLHMAPCFDRRYFEAIAEEVARLEADLVLCTGDIVEHPEAIAWIEPVLSRARGRLGQFAILGNHDLHYGARRIREALGSAGFLDLDGHWTRLESGGTSLAIGGTSAPWGPALELSTLPEADFRIVLSHTPDLFYRIARWKAVDLLFCGHNHGGQIRLPLVGPVLMPSRFSRRFDRGFFRNGRTLMHVSQGLGAKHPIRYNCPPELTRVVLQAAPLSIDLRPSRSARSAAEVGA